MAYKRTTRKTSGGAKMTTTYNTTTGRTRVTHTVKPTKSLTISRSRNKNGTIKTTRTYNNNGWVTRNTSSSGTGVVKAKKIRHARSVSYRGTSRRSQGGDAGGELLILLMVIVLFFPFWICKKLWQAAEETATKPENNDLDKVTWYYTKVFVIFLVYLWITAILLYYTGKLLLA